MNVTPEQRLAYKSDSIHKTLYIRFPDIDLTLDDNTQVFQESMQLKESILEKESIEFVGCIASVFSIQLYGVTAKLKGQKIEVKIKAADTDYIPLFHGIVDECKKEPGKNYIKITAYDELYTKGNIDVASWYKNLSFPITLGTLRRSLLSRIGLQYVDSNLPNDNVVINKQYNPETLQSLVVLKSLCQINGCFGIINRDGLFEFRYLKQTVNAVYPSIHLFPSTNLFPGGSSQSPYANAEIMGYYRMVEYQDFEVKPVDKVTIRQKEDDPGITFGSGENNYIIQANMFTYGLSNEVLAQIAQEVYFKVQNITYYPYISNNNGLPYAECGVDAVSFYYVQGEETYNKDFYIFNREITGIQALKDNFESKGEEYQNEFVTDINARLQTIQADTSKYDSKFDDYDIKFDDIYDTFGGQEVMIVVSWNPTTGILETTSTSIG